jgi:hypothetical protein
MKTAGHVITTLLIALSVLSGESTTAEADNPAAKLSAERRELLNRIRNRGRSFGSQDEGKFSLFPGLSGKPGGDPMEAMTADSLNMRVVGRWPYGPSYTVEFDEERNTAFLGSGGAVWFMEVPFPGSPVRTGELVTPGVVSGLSYNDNLLYIADGGEGLRVVSVENLSSPVELGSYDTPLYALAVTVQDTLAFLLDVAFLFDVSGPVLRLISIADPSNMYEVGHYDIPGEFAWNVAVKDTLAFLAANLEGLRIVSFSNPALPVEIGHLPTPYGTMDVAVSGTVAYLAEADGGLRTVSIADPRQPRLLGSSPPPPWDLDLIVDIKGSYAYVAGAGLLQNYMRVVWIADPRTPLQWGIIDTLQFPVDITVDDDRAFVADSWKGLWVISVAYPHTPYVEGSYDSYSWTDDVKVVGSHAYLAHANKGLEILSISDPSNPEELGSLYTGRGFSSDIIVEGEYAYMLDDVGLLIVSVADPAHPSPRGTYDSLGIFADMDVVWPYVYIADEYNGFRVVSVDDPWNPDSVGFFDTQGNPKGLAVRGDYAYVAEADSALSRLSILSIADPTHLSPVGHLDTPYYAVNVAVKDFLAFVAEGEGGLRSVSIEDPLSPRELNRCETGYNVFEVISFGSYTCLPAGEFAGVRILDPWDCSEKAFYNTPGQAVKADVQDSLIYVADSEGGLVILEYNGPSSITEPGNPGLTLPKAYSLFQNYPNPFNPSTTISFDLPEGKRRQYVDLGIYDIRGRLVRKLIDSSLEPGTHKVCWDGRDERGMRVPSGVYLYVLKAGNETLTRKMTALK